MKKTLIILLSFLISFSCFAKNWDIYSDASAETLEIINTADELIKTKQYQSAFYALTGTANTQSEYLIYKKVEIVTQYFAYSMMHQLFALKNLEKKETLDYIRTKCEGELSMFNFNVEEIISNAQKTNKSPVLNLALAQFYSDTLYRYGNQWFKTPQELMDLAIKNYKIAYDADLYDTTTLGNYSELLLKSKKYDEAENLYKILTAKASEVSKYWYNYTLVCMRLGKYEKAVELGKTALEYPEPNPAYELDEYTILADAYLYQKDFDSTFEVLKKAQKKFKKSGTPSIRLGELEIYANGDVEAAKKYFIKGFKIEPTAYNENFIADILLDEELYDEAIEFLEDALKIAKKDYSVKGMIYYDLAGIYYSLGDSTLSLENLLNSKKCFEEINDTESAEYIQSMIRKVSNE